jgi:acetylserotonin N-methyltransferase
MAQDLTAPDPAIVLDLLAAYRRSKTMFAAVELGVFDALRAGKRSLAALSDDLNCNSNSLERLLDALVGLRLLDREGESYRNTDTAAAYLTSTDPRRFTGYVKYSNAVGWKLWGCLEDAIREGTHRWPQAFGWDEPIFSSFFNTPAAMHEFLMGMNGFGVLSSPHVVNAFDLSEFSRIVDLGTASGHLVIAACHRWPHLQATAFDLPQALPLARELIAASPYADRIDVVEGDFFQDALPAGDLFALGRILHDWSMDKIRLLLARIYDALPSGGGLLIAEKMLEQNRRGPSWAQMQDLNMLVCTEGRERTLQEYDELLQAAGFVEVTGVRTSSPIDAILARKR